MRHGQSMWQVNCCPTQDSEITHIGKLQASYLNTHIRNLIKEDFNNSIVYVSPLKRAIQTIEGLGIDYVLEPDIKEAPFHVASSLPQFNRPFVYGREFSKEPNYTKFKNDLKNVLDKIILNNNNKNVYLYTHGGVIKTIIRIIHDNDSICYTINNCSVTKIIWENSRWKIKVLNDVSFLPKDYIT